MPTIALRAFVVEDNALVRENLASALEALAPVAVTGMAAEEDEALAWVQAAPAGWDLLVLDLFLRSGSGMGLLQRLPPRRPHQRVVVFSNYVEPEVRKRCAQLGADAVFDKSTELDALVDYCTGLCITHGAGHPRPPTTHA